MKQNRLAPVRKIAAQIWLAVAGNAAVAGVIAGTDHDYRKLGLSVGSSVAIILTGYITKASAGDK